jgi:hypothetical protein
MVAERVSDERLRNTRAWAQAKVGSLSGAEVIVGAIDELLELRAHFRVEPAVTNLVALLREVRKSLASMPGCDCESCSLITRIDEALRHTQRCECARLRAVLSDLKTRLIEVNQGIPEMGNIDAELMATIDCALNSPAEPTRDPRPADCQRAGCYEVVSPAMRGGSVVVHCPPCPNASAQNRPAEGV